MTSRERILAAMRLDMVDRTPVAPFGLGRLSGSVAKELIAKTDPFIEAGVPGSKFFGASCSQTVITEDNITTIIRQTPRGELVERHQSTGIASACIEFPVKTPDDVDRFLSIDYVPPELDVSPFLARKSEIGEEGLVLCGMANAVLLPATLLSPEDFSLWWIDYPDLLRKLVSVASTRLNDWVDRLCKAGVDAFRIIGGEYASVQLGPAGFDDLVLEQDRELVSIMHNHGAVAYYHNHGPVMRYLSRFCEIGMDALDPLEAPPWGDADLRAARQECGAKVCFVGNLDDMEILDKLSADEVTEIALERLQAAGKTGFILGGTASGTFSEHAARNFMRLVDVVNNAV